MSVISDDRWPNATDPPQQTDGVRSRTLPPVPRRHVKILTIAGLCGIAVLNGADVLTTKALLARSAVEANPLAGLLLAKGSLLFVKLGLVLLLAAIALRVPPKVGVLVLTWSVLGLYTAAVLSNVLILRIT